MYLHEEGIKDQKKKERSALMIMGLFLVLIAAFVWGTLKHKGFNTVYFACYILLFAAGVWASKLYLFLTPRRRYGTVVSMSDFEEKHSITNPGTYARRTGQYTKMDFTLELRFENGKTKYFEFEFTGALKDLKAGDSVGIYRFLKMPVQA